MLKSTKYVCGCYFWTAFAINTALFLSIHACFIFTANVCTDLNKTDFIFVSNLFSWSKGPLIGDTIFTTLKWMKTFHMTDIHINTFMSPRANGLTSLSKKKRKSNRLEMLEQRQHLLLNYFKTQSVGSTGNRTQASRMIDWYLTNKANQAAVTNLPITNWITKSPYNCTTQESNKVLFLWNCCSLQTLNIYCAPIFEYLTTIVN